RMEIIDSPLAPGVGESLCFLNRLPWLPSDCSLSPLRRRLRERCTVALPTAVDAVAIVVRALAVSSFGVLRDFSLSFTCDNPPEKRCDFSLVSVGELGPLPIELTEFTLCCERMLPPR